MDNLHHDCAQNHSDEDMKLSTKCRYGVRAVFEIAKNYNKTPTKRKEIAQVQDLDESYLENILIDLKNANIVSSIRGVNGGFVLKMSPRTITILKIVESLQGTLTPLECLIDTTVCPKVESCVTRPVWQRLKEAQEEVLSGCTIQDLLDAESQNGTEFFI